MKKGILGKIIGVIFVVIAAVVILGIMAIILFGNRALRVGIETGATKALKVDVGLEEVSLSIFRGRMSLSNLTIGNPEGYQHEKLMTLGTSKVDVNVKSLMSDTVNIEQIKFGDMSIVVEQKGLTNNLQEILDSLPKKEGKSKQEEKEEVPEGTAGKNLKISELEIRDVDVSVKLLPVPGRADTVTFKLAPIKMSNLGTDDKLSLAELLAKILGAIAGGVVEQGGDLLPTEMIDPLKTAVSERGGELIEAGVGILEGSEDAGKKVTEALQGLFEKQDDK